MLKKWAIVIGVYLMNGPLSFSNIEFIFGKDILKFIQQFEENLFFLCVDISYLFLWDNMTNRFFLGQYSKILYSSCYIDFWDIFVFLNLKEGNYFSFSYLDEFIVRIC